MVVLVIFTFCFFLVSYSVTYFVCVFEFWMYMFLLINQQTFKFIKVSG